MVLVLCYDVSDDKRRARLFKKLKGFLTPVQESVFEGNLPDARWGDLLRMVKTAIRADADTVRIYTICGRCQGAALLLGTAEKLRAPGEPILI